MTETEVYELHIVAGTDTDDTEMERLTTSLAAVIRELGVESVAPVERATDEDRGKGLTLLLGWLTVHLSVRQARRLLQIVVDWADQNRREVEIRDGDRRFIARNLTSEQLEKLINDWLDRDAS